MRTAVIIGAAAIGVYAAWKLGALSAFGFGGGPAGGASGSLTVGAGGGAFNPADLSTAALPHGGGIGSVAPTAYGAVPPQPGVPVPPAPPPIIVRPDLVMGASGLTPPMTYLGRVNPSTLANRTLTAAGLH